MHNDDHDKNFNYFLTFGMLHASADEGCPGRGPQGGRGLPGRGLILEEKVRG